MEKKKLKKLQLNKKTIASLQHNEMAELQGGTGASCIGNCPPLPTPTAGDCDLHTIGHDDGPNCLSARTRGFCFLCYGI